MSIDIDNIEFNKQTEYKQEIHYNTFTDKRYKDYSAENIYTIPVGESFVSYRLDMGSKPNEASPINLLELEHNPNFFTDVILSLNEITNEIADLSLPDSDIFFQSNPLDDQNRQVILSTFNRIDEMLLSGLSVANLQKEIKPLLQILAESYLNIFWLSEYYSFEHLSLEIDKIKSQELTPILQTLQSFGQLNESIINLKKQLVPLFNHIEKIKLTSGYLYEDLDEDKLKNLISMTEKFLQEIESKRFLCKRDFFSDYIDKNQMQALMQTINSLCLYELNKVKQNLNLINEKLADLTPNHEEFTTDREEVNSSSWPNLRNKKVVIFTCSYGNGHKITAATLEQTLQKASAHPVIYDLSVGPLLGKDRWRQLFKFFGIQYGDHPINGVDIFNEILRNQFYFIVNMKDAVDGFVRKMLDISGKEGVISPLGLWTNSWEKTQVRELLFIERPDHIITTYHMDLNPILEVAEELGIPILHIPTDYNMKFGEVFGENTPEYPHFKSLVPNYDVEETLQTKHPLRSDQLIEKIGIPLRQEFYQFLDEEDLLSYRRGRGIADDEKILLISAGGNGQNLPHPEHLANSPTWNLPLRVLVIAGKNRDFATHLQHNLKPQNGNPCILKGKNSNVTIEIVTNSDLNKIGSGLEFFVQADQLSKILDISDASIAKAGGLSVAELLFKGVPIIFDQRVNPFSWELFNMEVANSRQMAISNFYLKDLEHDLKQIFEIPKKRNENFYFESALESFSQCLNDQIHHVESDDEAISKKGHLILQNLKE